MTNKEKVVALLKSIETGAAEPIGYINPNKYTQHNLGAADGLEGFGELMKMLPANTAKANTVRAFQDGDFVVAHTEYDFFGPKIGFDIFKFENGQIVEHWDNLQETVTETGHKAEDDPEAVVKVDLKKSKLDKVVVKFEYQIRVTNEGQIAGSVEEISDYIPEGLKFVAADNPGWTDLGNNVISTNLLENTLLQPGEYADVEVVLTWINSENNMGVMTNTAEISKDYNEYHVPDRDSTPDNKKPGEDDIDDAPVMLSISTGQMRIYFTLGFIVLVTVAGGVVLIRKYVL